MALTRVGRLPEGVVLGAFAREVFDAIARYAAFPWPVLKTQCERANIDPLTLSPADLEQVLPAIVAGVELFTSPAKGAALRSELLVLLARARQG